jgi:predicted ATPase/DNA-binding winged helix-turn-helix (wHTH) protein
LTQLRHRPRIAVESPDAVFSPINVFFLGAIVCRLLILGVDMQRRALGSLRFGPFELSSRERVLRREGFQIPLGSRALDILAYLAERPGEVIPKKELLDRVWSGVTVEEGSLRVHVAAIRKALRDGQFGNRYIANIKGRGYSFVGTVVRLEDGKDGGSNSPNFRGRLPTRPLMLIGRDEAARLLRDLVSAYRVVTLTGPGGIGKSSLAIEVGHGILGDFQGGGWFVELASLADEDLVPSAVASVLGLKLMGGAISAEAVAQAIGDANLLLILDNCEHVIDAAAELAEAVVRFCPRVSVLATSREVLRIDGEQVYHVPPLGVPEVGQEQPERVLRCGAVELLMARTRALDSAFSSATDEIPSIAAICRQLDGIPLAIEFAAARAATLGFRRVAAGLGDRFQLLTNGRRTALPRHRTLRAALDWSYELLSPDEQRLLCHLAIFPGAFTFEAAGAVGAPEVTGDVVIDRISSLVEKSLLTADEGDSAPCWRLLETIRAYALQKLAESGEYLATGRRHAECVRAIIVPSTTEPVLTVGDLIRHGRELDNVRAALEWAFSPDGDVAIGVALVAAFAPVWIHLSLVGECRRRAEQVVGMVGSDLQLTRALEYRLIMALGVALTLTLGPIQQTREVIAKARQLAVGIDDTEVQLRMLWAQCSMELNMGEYGAALGTAQQFTELVRRQGDDALMLVSDRLLGTSMLRVGELNDARHCLERMVNRYIAPPSGHHTILFHFDQRAMARANLARVLALQGHLDRAKQEAKLSLEEVHDADKVTICWVLQNGAFPVALMTGDLAAADESTATMSNLATSLDAALWKIVASCWKGKSLIARRKFSEGSALLREALDLCERSGWRLANAEFLGDLARGLGGLERFDEAIATVDRALVRAESSHEHWCQAELIRIKGEVLLQQRPENEARAEGHFRAAIEFARTQGAIFWELRAALSAARLRVSQKNRAGAAQILEPVYNRFSEGFDTADMLAAKQLLDG